jgi:hypothetical protein
VVVAANTLVVTRVHRLLFLFALLMEMVVAGNIMLAIRVRNALHLCIANGGGRRRSSMNTVVVLLERGFRILS